MFLWCLLFAIVLCNAYFLLSDISCMSLLSLFYIDALFYALYMSMSFIAVSVTSIRSSLSWLKFLTARIKDWRQPHHFILILRWQSFLRWNHFVVRQHSHKLRDTCLVTIQRLRSVATILWLLIKLIIFLRRRLLKWALVCTIEIINRTIKEATSLIIRTLKVIFRRGWRHILHYLLHQKLGRTR